MRIGSRLFVVLAVPIAGLIAVFSVLEDRQNRLRSQEEVAREGWAIARTVELAVTDALRDHHLGDLHTLIDGISGHENVLGVRLFDRDGTLSYQSASLRNAAAIPVTGLREVLSRENLFQARATVLGKPVIAWLVPLRSPSGSLLGAVQVLQLETFVEEDAVASSRAIAILAAILILAVALTVWIVARMSVVGPIEELVQSVREVGSGDLSARVPVRRRDEFGRLADEFNAMCRRLEVAHASLLAEQEERRRVEANLREAERLASIGRFAAGLAHEIGTPLNVISGRAESLLRKGAVGEAEERHVRIIASQIERIARIVRRMLDFARAREMRLAPTDLPAVLARVTELVEERLDERGIRLETEIPSGLPALAADADQLHEVFLNLTVNAADAMPAGGMLRIRGRREARIHPERGGAVRPFVAVEFEDTGCGIAQENLDRVFDPFFTTKEVGSGTGLGLSVSYGIVQEHGGWIEIESEVGQGTRVTVFLPLEHGVPATSEPHPMEAA